MSTAFSSPSSEKRRKLWGSHSALYIFIVAYALSGQIRILQDDEPNFKCNINNEI
jgi:hypothetical protein